MASGNVSGSLRHFLYRHCPHRVRLWWDRVEASALGSRLANGVVWSVLGALVSRLMSLAAFVVTARVLGTEAYGKFGVIQSTVSMFGVFAGFGLGQTATRYVAELRDKESERAGRIMALAGVVALVTGAFIAALLFIWAPWLAENTLAAPELVAALRISAFILLFEAMNGAQMGALAGFEAFKTTAKISIWTGVASFIAMVFGVYLGGLEGGVAGLLLSRIINWLLNHLALRREAARSGVPFGFRGMRRDFSVLWHFSLPSMLSGVMVSPTLWICNAMVVNQPDGYAQMGIFQAASTFKQVMLVVGTTFGAPFLPMLANLAGKESDRFAKANILSTWILGAVPAVFLLGLPEVAQFAFGKGFKGDDFTRTYTLVVLSATIVVYKQGLARVLAAHGMMWWGMLSNLLWAVTLIGCTRFLAPWGAFGFAVSYAIAYSVNTAVVIPLYTRKGLVPSSTLISLEAACIWLVLLGGVALNLLSYSLYFRLTYMALAAPTLILVFYRLLVNERVPNRLQITN